MSEALTKVELDRLDDHDLLVRIATRVESLPCGRNEERILQNQLDLASLKTENRATTLLAGIAASIIGVFVNK